MASFKTNKRKDGSIVSYKVTVSMGRKSDGKQIIKTATFPYDPTKTEKQNEKARDVFIHEFSERCKSGRVLSDKIKLKDFAEVWFEKYVSNLEKTTQSNYRIYLDKNIIPKLGHYKLSEIRVQTVQDFLNDMQNNGYDYGDRKGKYSKSAVQTAKKVLSSLLSYAVENDILDKNPAAVKFRQHNKVEPKKQVKCFSIQQATDFLSFIEKPIQMIVPEQITNRNGKRVVISEYVLGEYTVQLKYQAAFTLTIFSGIRKEELLGLKWKDIDFIENMIDVNEAVVYLSGEGYIEKSPKSGAGYRKIYLPQSCMNLLKKLKIEQQKRIIEQGTAWRGSRDIGDCWCFTQENGLHMSPSTVTKELQRLIKAYNKLCENENDRLPVITFHQLRHTNASILIAQGLEATVVAERLGHSNPSVTLGIYAHSFEERNRAASNALESAFESAKNKESRKSV